MKTFSKSLPSPNILPNEPVDVIEPVISLTNVTLPNDVYLNFVKMNQY